MADNKKLQAFHDDMAELMKRHPDIKLDVQIQAEIVAIDLSANPQKNAPTAKESVGLVKD